MSDGRDQEPYDFSHMWDIKQKATNEQTKLMDTDNSVVVSSREGGLQEDEEGKGG